MWDSATREVMVASKVEISVWWNGGEKEEPLAGDREIKFRSDYERSGGDGSFKVKYLKLVHRGVRALLSIV